MEDRRQRTAVKEETEQAGGTKGRAALWGVVRRREAWCLSGRGWVVLLVLAAGVFAAGLYGIYPFLAVTNRVESRILIVDGFDVEYALKASLGEFQAGPYERLVTTGGLCAGETDLDPDDTYARLAADRLKRLGARPGDIDVVPAAPVRRDRTYASAVAVRNWLARNYPQVRGINIISIGPHARRTRLLYQKALGKTVAVGMISIADQEYDPQHWWRYSEGVKQLISETAAYIYARAIFRPEETSKIN